MNIEKYTQNAQGAIIDCQNIAVEEGEIERTAQGRVKTMLPHMMEVAGVTEELKACDSMRWVGLMNTLKAQAEEIIQDELIYK